MVPPRLRRAHLPVTARAWIAPLAAIFALVTILSDPGDWWQVVLLALAVLLFAGWYRWPLIMPAMALAIPVLVGAAAWSGALEGGLFQVSLVALAAAAWVTNRILAGVIVAGSLLVPPALALVSPDAEINWAIWMGGILFPAVLGLIVRRLEQLTDELAGARLELADRAVADERRRIARDVHDLVGHGLAAVLLQVTSARHVLRRDPDSADEALRSAEDVGRRSMQELRRTVDLLRRDDDAPDTSLPRLSQLRGLAESFGGVDGRHPIAYCAEGDLGAVDPAVGVTAYRIAQESLANAVRHAPAAATSLTVLVTGQQLTLTVDTVGPIIAADPNRSEKRRHYGLLGMQERAAVVGGQISAGRTSEGWTVRCELPLIPTGTTSGSGRPGEAMMDR
ncbi:sensor histidine kinase [Nakamurella lactea]|uniref:sensor histidine kinase n=1 Tax=Nakamurella lactea TaxID=459515 RepID=UPI001376E600|nr:histidine kinase [Nakamurella lactea]